MDENHQGKTGSKLMATEEKLWLPPLSPKEQEQLDRLQKRRTKANNEKREVAHQRMNPLATFFKTWATPIGTVITVGTLLWGVISFTLQQQAAQSQALDQRRQTTLQTYLDDMTKLLLEGKLLESQPNNAVSQIARAKTLTTLRQLDPERKGAVIQFLSEARLIESEVVTGHPPIISLATADLSEVDLSAVVLFGADLRGADLSRANLDGAFLGDAKLTYADLDGADLRNANLTYADLDGADLRNANLDGAFLFGADLHSARLRGAHLDKTILKGARYNTKEIVVKDPQGRSVKFPLTQWPQGFDPKAAGAIEKNTSP